MSGDIITLSPRTTSKNTKPAAPAAVVQHPATFSNAIISYAQRFEPLINETVKVHGAVAQGMLATRPEESQHFLGMVSAARYLAATIRANCDRYGDPPADLSHWLCELVISNATAPYV